MTKQDKSIIDDIETSITAIFVLFQEKRDLIQSYDKIPYTNGQLKNKVTTQNRH